MFAVFVFSPRCNYCNELYGILKQTPFLDQIQMHNVHEKPIPNEYKDMLKSVPAIVTREGNLLMGEEAKRWATDLIPSEIESFTRRMFASFDGNPNLVPGLFDLESYGTSLAPPMTPEIEQKISRKLTK